jgi:uracil-DNA glycosylase
MSKKLKWLKLKEEMSADKTLPLRATAANLVFGEGSLNPKVYFMGEAPGRTEDETGRPFVGRAGKLLTELIESLGISRKHIYITSIVRYRPPKNRYPKPSEVKAHSKYVDQELALIKPELIVPLGRLALAKFLPNETITESHGKVFRIKLYGKETTVVPMYHPAAGLRNPKFKKALFKDFKVLRKLLR